MIGWGRELIAFARHQASRAQPRSSDETVGRRPEIYRCVLRGVVWSGPPLDWVWCTPLCFWQRLLLLCSISLQILIRGVQTRPPWGWWRGGGIAQQSREGGSRRGGGGGYPAESFPAFLAKLRKTRVGLAHCRGRGRHAWPTAALQDGGLDSNGVVWQWECWRCRADNWKHSLSPFLFNYVDSCSHTNNT